VVIVPGAFGTPGALQMCGVRDRKWTMMLASRSDPTLVVG
jgi:hypothetical protein